MIIFVNSYINIHMHSSSDQSSYTNSIYLMIYFNFLDLYDTLKMIIFKDQDKDASLQI